MKSKKKPKKWTRGKSRLSGPGYSNRFTKRAQEDSISDILKSVGPLLPTLLMAFQLSRGQGYTGMPYLQEPFPFGKLTVEQILQDATLRAKFFEMLRQLDQSQDLMTRAEIIAGIYQMFGANVDAPETQAEILHIAQSFSPVLDILSLFAPQLVASLHGSKGTLRATAIAILPYLQKGYITTGDINPSQIAKSIAVINKLAPQYGFTSAQLARIAGILHEEGVARLDDPQMLARELPQYAKLFAAARFYEYIRSGGKRNIVDPEQLKGILEKVDWYGRPDQAAEQLMGMAAIEKGITTVPEVVSHVRKALEAAPPTPYRQWIGKARVSTDTLSQVISGMQKNAPFSFEGRLLGALLWLDDMKGIRNPRLKAAVDAVKQGDMLFTDPLTGSKSYVVNVLRPTVIKNYLDDDELQFVRSVALDKSMPAPSLHAYPHAIKYVPLMMADTMRAYIKKLWRSLPEGMNWMAAKYIMDFAKNYGFPSPQIAAYIGSPEFIEAYAKAFAKHVEQAKRYKESLKTIRSPDMVKEFVDTLRRMGHKAFQGGETKGPFGILNTLMETMKPVLAKPLGPLDIPEPDFYEGDISTYEF